MKPKFRINQKVKITHSQNKIIGTVIGIDYYSSKTYLGHINIKEFLGRFDKAKYKIVFEDTNQDKIYTEWLYEEELEKIIREKK